MDKFKAIILKSSPVAVKMMLYGTKLALGVLLIGIAVYKYNELFVGEYENAVFGIKIIQAAFSLFVQFILGGLIFDCLHSDKK